MEKVIYNKYIDNLIEESKMGKVRENTIKSVKADLNTLYNYLDKQGIQSEEEYFRNVTADNIKYMVNELNNKYKPSTLNRKLITFRSYFKYVINNSDLIDINYFDESKLYGQDILEDTTKQKDIISISQVKKLLKVADIRDNEKEQSFEFNSKRNKAIITILACYGNRIEEILSSKFSDIKKTETGIMYIDIPKRRVKNKLHKRIFIANAIKDSLEDYLKVRDTKLLHNDDDYIFVSYKSGKKLNNDYINSALSNLCDKANINKKITCHCFRSICTLALQDNFTPSYLIDEIVGWKKSGDMQARYSNHLPKEKIDKIISATNLI